MASVADVLQAAQRDINKIEAATTKDVMGLAILSRDLMSIDKLEQTQFVRKFIHEGRTARNMVTGGSYESGDNLSFALSKRNDRAFAIASVQQQTAIVVTHVGLIVDTVVQELTLQEVLDLGTAVISQRDSKYRDVRVPMAELIIQPVMEQGTAMTTDTTTSLGNILVAPVQFGPTIMYELPRALLIQPDEIALIELIGLTGTVAGSTPTLTMRPKIAGWEFVLS